MLDFAGVNILTQPFNEVPLTEGPVHRWSAPEQHFQWLQQDVGRKNACTGRTPREQLYWDHETKRESGLFLSLGCNAAHTASHVRMPTRMGCKPQKHQGERVIWATFFPPLKMKFIYSTADGTKPSQVWFSFHCTGTEFSLGVGGRWLRCLCCLMAFFPQVILLSGLDVWNWKHNF